MSIYRIHRSMWVAVTLALFCVVAAYAHTVDVDGDKQDWLSGFGSSGCPNLPAVNTSGIFSYTQGCQGPKGTEFIWTDALNDHRTDFWGGTGNLDLKEFRMTGDTTQINFLLEFADVTDCSAQYIAIAINTDDSRGTTNFPDNADTNLSNFGSGYERVVVANMTKTGYYSDNASFSVEGNSYCQETTNLWEISFPLAELGMSWPAAIGDYDFAVAVFCRATDGSICDVSGMSDVMDAITTSSSTLNEVIDGNLGYNFTTTFNPTAVSLTDFSARTSSNPLLSYALIVLMGIAASGVLAWLKWRG